MYPSTQSTIDLTKGGQASRNRVLRNTYWLLALSMIPTVRGAFLGVSMGVALFSGILRLRDLHGHGVRLHVGD